jgi:cytochrome P450
MTVTALPPLEAPASPAGPLEEGSGPLPEPPNVDLPRALQVLRFNQRQIEFVFRLRREHGDVFRMRGTVPGGPVVTCHPDHIGSLFKNPDLAPSLTGESPVRPVVGPDAVLTANGPRHMRQRKLLLPQFHGDMIDGYVAMIRRVTERSIERWPTGQPMALAPRMQAITLDVIMSGIFGIDGRPERGTPEAWLRETIRWLVYASTLKVAQVAELMNVGHAEPVGFTRVGLEILDRPTYAVIRSRRRTADLGDRRDVLSLLINARTEDGEALTDEELRNELLTLVLAGHETTANQLAWTWERLVRSPQAHERLVTAVREGSDDADEVVEHTIQESMRSRPVVPMIGRRVTVPWRLGEYGVDAGTPITMSILLLHHREDLYPDPFSFRPERWEGRKPKTYEWIPFGGGIRRCLGAALAMAEQRVVLTEMARRLDVRAADAEPEHARHRNVTMIPSRGGRVVITARGARPAGAAPR